MFFAKPNVLYATEKSSKVFFLVQTLPFPPLLLAEVVLKHSWEEEEEEGNCHRWEEEEEGGKRKEQF